ncbi:MAG: hypothetical protein K9K64_15065 [Desulfohalobiaceae bacterium]|nr:hypothetical protein [Desulfohalobiaceae bacterium]
MHRLISLLHQQAESIRQLESEADRVLHKEQDPDRYRDQLLEKAEILADLPEKARPFLQDLDPGLQKEVADGLRMFAQRADMALRLNSPFFMRQLLYPEDYREGDNNNLEGFIRSLESRV